jgi:selenium-binding protein 1
MRKIGLGQRIAAMLPNTVYDESSSLVTEPILPVALRRGLLSGNALPTRIIEQYTEKAKVSKASWIEQESIVAIIFLVAFGRFAASKHPSRQILRRILREGRIMNMSLMPDPTFYPSPRMAMQATPERLAYVALLNDGKNGKHDAMGVIDLDPSSSGYGRLVGQVDFGRGDNELHHFGWNACSACLCPQAPHPHMERRYLIVPGIGSSRIYILDTKPNPMQPKIVKVIEPEEFTRKTGYTSPHTIHCGPDCIYGSALGSASGDGPGGIFLMDANTFELKGQWEKDRGPQQLAYDFWWHLGHDTMITSEWGTPNMVKDGVNPELLLAGKYGHKIHIWDLDKRRHLQEVDLGAEQQWVLELRPSHDPQKTYGFVGVGVSLKDLSSSIWMWYREDGGKNSKWAVRKIIEIPAEPADPEKLPPLLKGFKAVPPLVTDINLSLDDRFLYVSCWGTGEFIQYDVSDPANPKKRNSVHLGGIVRRAAHPSKPDHPLNGGPQMVEMSRDGKRVYFTNSLYSPWDDQIYPDGLKSWMVKLDADPKGGMKLDDKFFVEFDGLSAHQVRLEGGDASSDSYCYSEAK